MVLADLGAKISEALKKLGNNQTIDERMVNDLITEIASALLSSDVNIQYVNTLRNSVKTTVALQNTGEMGGSNLKKIITKTVVDELTNMLSSKNKAPEFVRGK
jgi:signal recognition particle subunit SRP54